MSLLSDLGTKVGAEFKSHRLRIEALEASGGEAAFGQLEPHSTYDDFNVEPNHWGWTFVKGNTNAPHTNSAQWYRGRFSLGDAYGKGSDTLSYWLEITYPRYNNNGEMWLRTCEAGSPSAWKQVGSAGTTAQYHIMGSPTNTGGSGIATSFFVKSSTNLSWNSDRITVPISGVYSISFNTISDSGSGRVDADIYINGQQFISLLNEDNGYGYHQKTATISVKLSAGDYIQFSNNDWYAPTSTNYNDWRTASVTFLG